MPLASITTETDLTTGSKTFILPANPVPVITPMGPAPGELRVSASAAGRVTEVRAVLQPKGADVVAIADLLSRLASFDLPAASLLGLGTSQPVVTFRLQAEAVSELTTLVHSAKDLEALLREPVLQAGERYRVEDLVATY